MSKLNKLHTLFQANAGVILPHGILSEYAGAKNPQDLRNLVHRVRSIYKVEIWMVERKGYVFWNKDTQPRIPKTKTKEELCLPPC